MSGAKRTLSKTVAVFVVLISMLCGCKPKGLSFEFVMLTPISYAIQTFSGGGTDVIIPTEYQGYPVTHILCQAFRLSQLKTLRMETVTSIDDEAFYYCGHLEMVDLGSVERIGRNTFRYCRSLTSVTIPATCMEIDFGAFANCEKLEAVYFMGTPERIDPSAFDKGVTIYGPENSIVEEFARENGFVFVAWKASSSSDN